MGLRVRRVVLILFELAFVVTRDNKLLDALQFAAFAANFVQVRTPPARAPRHLQPPAMLCVMSRRPGRLVPSVACVGGGLMGGVMEGLGGGRIAARQPGAVQ